MINNGERDIDSEDIDDDLKNIKMFSEKVPDD